MSNFRIIQGTVFDTLPKITPGSVDVATWNPAPDWCLTPFAEVVARA